MSAVRDKIRDKADNEIKENEKGKFIFKVFAISAVLIFFAGISIFVVVKEKYDNYNNGIVFELSDGSQSSETFSCFSSQITENIKVPVYIAGAVRSPGIYETFVPVYLYEVVEMAGGLTESADRLSVNLAFRITENMMIVIPEIREDGSLCSGGYTEDVYASSLDHVGSSSSADERTSIDINTADLAKLCILPGIGESTARAIIRYREENGPFTRTEDIMKVPGIKQNRFEIIKDMIIV